MNILILNYEYPPLGGGAGIVTKHLVEEFAKKQHKVTIITTWFPGESEFYMDNNVHVIRLKSLRKKTYESNPREMYSWIKHAKKYFKERADDFSYDVCLANFTLPCGDVARYLKNKFKLPYVVLSHGHDIPWAYPKKMLFWHLLFYYRIKKICMNAERTILLSRELKEVADNFLGNEHNNKNIVFFNGMYMDHFNERLKSNVLKIVFVGRLVQQKNPFLFLNAIKLLQQSNVPYEIEILGDGELKNKMQDFVAANYLDHISFKGKISHAEVINTLGNAHLLVSTSESEGMSMSILEAISSGIYVIATNVSGNDNMIVENVNGNIVEADASLIAEKAKSFYMDKLKTGYTFPENYTAIMKELFSWEKISKQYEDLFSSILK